MHPLGVVPETAVGCLHRRGSERDIVDCFFFLTRTGRAWSSEAESSGGTLSAPTGCSPRDPRRLRAVGGSLRALFFLHLANTRIGRTIPSGYHSSGGTLSAPTGCSPRDYCRSFTIGSSLKNLDSEPKFVFETPSPLGMPNGCLVTFHLGAEEYFCRLNCVCC